MPGPWQLPWPGLPLARPRVLALALKPRTRAEPGPGHQAWLGPGPGLARASARALALALVLAFSGKAMIDLGGYPVEFLKRTLRSILIEIIVFCNGYGYGIVTALIAFQCL